MPRRIVWTIAIAAGLAAATAIVLPYAASTQLVGDRIAEEMSEWSGFDVRIGAAPEISFWPDLQANLSNVTLSQPGGGPVLTARRVEIELSALAALGGDIDFTRTRFIGPTIRIEDDEPSIALPRGGRIARALDTAREIVAENPTAPDAARLPADDFGVVEFSDGTVVGVSGGAEAELANDLSGTLGWARLNGRASLTASGLLRGEAFKLELSSASPLLLFGGAATPATLSLTSAPANLSFDGTANLGDNPFAEGQARFSAPAIRKVFDWSRTESPLGAAVGSIAVESRVMGDRARIRLEDASITLDGEPAHGAIDLLLGGKAPKVSGTLAFETLDLGAFLSAFTPFDPWAGDGPGAIDADFASRLNLDLRLSAARATAGAVTLANLAATARVDEGTAAIDISDAAALGGTLQAGLRFDRKAMGEQVEMRLLATDIDGAAFSAAAGMTWLAPSGRGTVSLILKGAGENWKALLDRADGSLTASFGRGALPGIDLDALVSQAKSGAPFALGDVETGNSPIDGLEIKALVSRGVATIDKAEIRSPLHRIALSGAATLAGGDLKLTGRAEPPQANADAADPTAATMFLIEGPSNAAMVTPTGALSGEE
ncbi:AsmA family protein [Mesorhizobium marinum]|uniref:AsmA family protein n=1 Tax=Mesorhizobium marinum TaxID=3228790 RepID=UPI0034666A60